MNGYIEREWESYRFHTTKYPMQYTGLFTYVRTKSLYKHYLIDFQLYLVTLHIYINDLYYDL